MNWFHVSIATVVALILVVAIVRFVVGYSAAKGTFWQRVLFVFRNSEVILFARIQQFIGAALAALSQLTEFAQMQQVDSLVHTLFTDARQMAIYGLTLLFAGFVTEKARLTGATKDPSTGAVANAPGTLPAPAPVAPVAASK